MSIKFGGIRQVGYVVRDIEKAMVHWSARMGGADERPTPACDG